MKNIITAEQIQALNDEMIHNMNKREEILADYIASFGCEPLAPEQELLVKWLEWNPNKSAAMYAEEMARLNPNGNAQSSSEKKSA